MDFEDFEPPHPGERMFIVSVRGIDAESDETTKAVFGLKWYLSTCDVSIEEVT